MKAHEADQHSWNHEDMQREKSRERGAGDNGSAQHQLYGQRADERGTAGDGGSDAESPVSVLIEAQDLSAEGHAQSHQQKKNADDPGELPGKLVGAEEEHLHHVNEDDRHHEVRAPTV